MNLKKLHIHDVELLIDADKTDFNWYQRREVFEERVSLLYPLLRKHGFCNYIDVGANYGMISIFGKKINPNARIIALEADPRLIEVIEKNLVQNGISDIEVLNCVVGSVDQEVRQFSLNPRSSLDNRVSMKAWEKVNVSTRRIDSIIRERGMEQSLFIKIDTQGYEYNVLKGGEGYLENNAGWLVKMEFAPAWLISQGTDPRELLEYLGGRYVFAEFPARLPYGLRSIYEIFSLSILDGEYDCFIDYVQRLNKDGKGWVDLLVGPKS